MGEELSRLRQAAHRLKKERDHLEALLMGTEPMIEGSLVKRYTVCGKKGCKCRQGRKHGPFLYLLKLVDGKMKTFYVPKGSWVKVRQMVDRYKRFKERRRRIRQLHEEIESLFDEVASVQKKDVEEVIKR